MKFRILAWNLSSSLFLLLNACQSAGTSPTPPGTSLPLATQSPLAYPTVALPSPTLRSPTSTLEARGGEIAYRHVQALSEEIGPRVAGSPGEAQAAQYLILEFERLGYISELHPFTVTVKGKTIHSANVMALKPGASRQEILVGAHYDSVATGHGADDNATGVAAILEVAERLRDQATPYTIRLILFGAEESDMQGSQYYVNRMTPDQIQNTVAMINLDSLGAGDLAYIYGDAGERGAIREWALDFAAQQGLPLQTQPGENPKYPAGTTGDWSDHAPFKLAGIPYTYLESTNWTLGNKDGYTQVGSEYGQDGAIWHTQYDTLDYINTSFPGRLQDRLALFVTILEAILTQFQLDS